SGRTTRSAPAATASEIALTVSARFASRSPIRGASWQQITRVISGAIRGRSHWLVAQQLSEHVELVEQRPVLDDLAVAEVQLRKAPEVDTPTCWGPVQAEAA